MMQTKTATMRRYRMTKGSLIVEAPETEEGRRQLETLRKQDPRFSRARIASILQLNPSSILLGYVYDDGKESSYPSF